MKLEDIRQVTGLSESLIKEYIEFITLYPESERLDPVTIPGSLKKMEVI
jgi:hypothetical protein